MKLVIVDYGSGNLRSVENALKTAAHDAGLPHQVMVSSSPDVVGICRLSGLAGGWRFCGL
jgi:imidazoleglycerol phosphate synthase glutamine amidotransferase subunit HisH